MQTVKFLSILAFLIIAASGLPTEIASNNVSRFEMRDMPYFCTPNTKFMQFRGKKGASSWCTFTNTINAFNTADLFLFDSGCKQIGFAKNVSVFHINKGQFKIGQKFDLFSELPYSVVTDMKLGRGFATSIDYAGRRSGGDKNQCWWTGENWNCSFQFLC